MLKAPLIIPEGEFDAYLYDCDGTIADTMPAHNEAWIAEMKSHGVTIDDAFLYQLAGMPATKTVGVINERFNTHFDREVIAQSKEDRFFNFYLDRIKPIPEVVKHLEAAFLKGIKIGVVSGGRKKIVEETLKILKIRDKVGALICAEDVIHGKPDPEPFLMAARILNVEPYKCLVFEDADLGIKSAENAHMKWVRIYT